MGMGHCEVCPLGPDDWSPSEEYPSFCRHIRAERDQPERAHHWTPKYFRAAGLGKPPRRDLPPPAFRPAPCADSRVRVGIISPCCYLGGAELWISDLLDHCDPARIHWSGIAIKHDPGVPEAPTVRADWEVHAPVGAGPAAIRALAAGSDVLVAWGVVSASWGLPVAELAAQLGGSPVPVVQVSHCAMDSAWMHEAQGLPRSIPVAVSRAALRGLAPEHRASARIVPNCANPARVARTRSRAEMLAEWGLPENVRVAGWLGRLSPEKRPERFIEGIAALPDGWFGVMAGSGLGLAAGRVLADQVAPGRVVIPGPRMDVGNVLGAFDALIMPSSSEAASLAAAEAWLAGVPLISTPVGLLEERPELARLMPRDPSGADVAGAVLADRADPIGTAQRVERAREYARIEMSPAAFGRNWSDLICEAAGPRPAPPTPGPLAMALSLGRAVAAHIADGARAASPEAQAARWSTCRACPELSPSGRSCTRCGCSLPIKIGWASSECPIGKWGVDPG